MHILAHLIFIKSLRQVSILLDLKYDYLTIGIPVEKKSIRSCEAGKNFVGSVNWTVVIQRAI